MKRTKFLALSVVLMLVTPALLRASDKKKDQGQASIVTFSVIKDDNGKPVRNAAVVLHPVNDDGKQAKNGFELKTDLDGKTEYDGVPYGKLRIQVIANGFQTFGDDFDIQQPQRDIVIRLKRPSSQYTIYGDQKPSSDPNPKQNPNPQ